MENYYISTDTPDLIIKKDGDNNGFTFAGIIMSMSEDDKKNYGREIGDLSAGWIRSSFTQMTDEQMEKFNKLYLINEDEDGNLFIVSQIEFTHNKTRFCGVVEWQRGHGDTFLGDIYEDSLEDFQEINGLELDRIIAADEEWEKEEREMNGPKFTVIYSEMVDLKTQKYVVKTAQSTDYEYDELVDFVSSLNENPFKINFVFEGHINPYSHE